MVKVISPPCGGSPLCVPALTDAASQPGCVANALKDRMLSEDPRCEPKRSSNAKSGTSDWPTKSLLLIASQLALPGWTSRRPVSKDRCGATCERQKTTVYRFLDYF
eukprot:7725208-Pyramimonas_sp.AAC.1